MDVCPRITGKDYENADGNPIVNVDAIVKALRNIIKLESFLRNKEDMETVHRFYGNNKEKFKKLWGRQSCCWVGYERWWIWKHEMDYCDLYVMTTPERGTAYEVVMRGPEDYVAGELEGFFAFMLNGLEDLEKSNDSDSR